MDPETPRCCVYLIGFECFSSTSVYHLQKCPCEGRGCDEKDPPPCKNFELKAKAHRVREQK
jgi:hypothetical protein